MPTNKVSPQPLLPDPLFGETHSTSSINHFDDNGPPIIYSTRYHGNSTSLIGGRIRKQTSFDLSSCLQPINFHLDVSQPESHNPVTSDSTITIENEQKILYYLASLESQTTHEDVDIEQLELLLKSGANVNASTPQGYTSLHQSVLKFPLRVSEWLVNNGARTETVDVYGWSALHLACIENRVDIVRLLCSHSPHLLYHQTVTMKHTPLHLASLSDATDVICELVHQMKDFLSKDADREVVFRKWLEMRDYQGRSALHLATQYDRSMSARFLLEHSLSYAATFDSFDQFCLVHMIEKMAFVSKSALDQFHSTDALTRKQVFHLNLLEKRTNRDLTRTPLDAVVQFKRFELVLHPIFEKLLEMKWRKYGFLFAIIQTAFYFTNLLLWSLFTIHPLKGDKYLYDFPTAVWRVILGFVCIAFLVFQIVEEFTELFKDIFEQNYFTKRMRVIFTKDRDNFPTYLETEQTYISNMLQNLKHFRNPYTGDFWNYIDWLAYILMVATIVSHLADVIAHSNTAADWHARIGVVNIIILWFRFLKYLRPFEFIGWFITILIYLKADIIRFTIFLMTLLIPYSIGVWVIYQFQDRDLNTFYSTVFTVFRIIVVDEYPFHIMRDTDEWMTYFIIGSYISIVSIVSLNLFIALLSNTFQTVYDNSKANATMEKARILLSFERKLPFRIMKYYYEHIHQKCKPLIENFDDDVDLTSGESATKLATENILTRVKGVENILQDFMKHVNSKSTQRKQSLRQYGYVREEGDRRDVEEVFVQDRPKPEIFDTTRFENLICAMNENISNVTTSIDSLNKRIGELEKKLHPTDASVRYSRTLPPVTEKSYK